MVPGFVRNWIAVNAAKQSSLNKKIETKSLISTKKPQNSCGTLRLRVFAN